MSCLWLCLSLLCAATFPQSSALSEVSVTCNETVNVVAGQTVTLNCTIDLKNCTGVRYHWNSTQGNICSNGLRYKCDWDYQTYVSLTISNVMEEDNYDVRIQADCSVTKPSTIKVQVVIPPLPLPVSNGETGNGEKQGENQDQGEKQGETTSVLLLVLGIAIALSAVGILLFLFGTDRGRGIIKCMKKSPGDDKDTAPGSEDLLIV